jgi:transcription antitermination factor NusG
MAPAPDSLIITPDRVGPAPTGDPSTPLVEVVAPWYAIWTRSRAEKVVFDQLLRKDIEAFLPTIRRVSRWKDRKKELDWPLFPGYCFARFDPQTSLAVLKCVGVAQIITADGKPAPIDATEIDAIRRLVTTEFKMDPCPLIKEGDMVEVIHGPLKGVVGRLIRKKTGTKLVLAITMINRAVEVEFDAADVRKY